MARYKHRKKTTLDKYQCILLLIIGLLMGSVFTFGMGHWNAAADVEDALPIMTEYQGYDVRYNASRSGAARRSIKVVDLHFVNHESLSIDGSCVNGNVLSALDNLRHGSILDLLLHPNGDMVLSIITDGVTILAFEDSMKSLSVER